MTAAAVFLTAVPGATRAASRVRAATVVSAPAAEAEDARSLYDAGERAYRRGRFQEALEKFEKAYDLSEQPLLLYNIALASRQLYDVAQDVEELRRGRAVLKNFMLFTERDPALDATDATKLLAEIEQLIEAHTEGEPNGTPVGSGSEPSSELDPRVAPKSEDPGRRFRIIGGATMGAGGVLFVGGFVAGIAFALKGKEFGVSLRRLRAENLEACPEGGDPMDTVCRQSVSDIDVARKNGNRANVGAGISFGIGGGLGVIGLAAGVVLFVSGNRRTKEWKSGAKARIPRVTPVVSRDAMGLQIRGRF